MNVNNAINVKSATQDSKTMTQLEIFIIRALGI